MPLRFCELHATPEFRRLSEGERWQVVESLCDAWFVGELPPQPAGVTDAARAVVERLWPTYEAEIAKATDISEKRRAAIRKRWDAHESRLNADSSTTTKHNKTKQLTPKGVRSRRPPAAFAPDDSHRVIAEERGIDLAAQLAAFLDYEFAAPKTDWSATFRNWLRKAQPTRRDGQRAHPTDLALARFLGGGAA
jgi:hypothetical protein